MLGLQPHSRPQPQPRIIREARGLMPPKTIALKMLTKTLPTVTSELLTRLEAARVLIDELLLKETQRIAKERV